jgi:hypothetical protein
LSQALGDPREGGRASDTEQALGDPREGGRASDTEQALGDPREVGRAQPSTKNPNRALVAPRRNTNGFSSFQEWGIMDHSPLLGKLLRAR